MKINIKIPPIIAEANMQFSTGLHALLGRNGVGKSTLFNAIAAGAASLNGRDLSTLSVQKRARLLAYVSQQFSPYFATSALDFVRFAAEINHPKRAKEQALNAARSCGCEHLLNRAITALSGGELALLRCASAWAQDSQVVIFDEPLAALDMAASAVLMGVLEQLAKDKIVIYSCHDPQAVRGQIYALQDGPNGSVLRQINELNEEILQQLYACNVFQKSGFFSY